MMSRRYEVWIGNRYVRSRSRNSFVSLISGISMLGIAIAVLVLIVVMSVVNGFERELKDRLLAMTAHAMKGDYDRCIAVGMDVDAWGRLWVAGGGPALDPPALDGQRLDVAGRGTEHRVRALALAGHGDHIDLAVEDQHLRATLHRRRHDRLARIRDHFLLLAIPVAEGHRHVVDRLVERDLAPIDGSLVAAPARARRPKSRGAPSAR